MSGGEAAAGMGVVVGCFIAGCDELKGLCLQSSYGLSQPSEDHMFSGAVAGFSYHFASAPELPPQDCVDQLTTIHGYQVPRTVFAALWAACLEAARGR